MNLSIQEAAEQDILREVERYAEFGVPDVGRRFFAATIESIDALAARPMAGAPKAMRNPRLTGLRTWPVKGFDEFRIYNTADAVEIVVVRILHGKRDISRLLEEEN